jgi:hypothetical protein
MLIQMPIGFEPYLLQQCQCPYQSRKIAPDQQGDRAALQLEQHGPLLA